MKSLALVALLPALVLAAPPPTARRTGVLLVPLDQTAEAKLPQLETYMYEALETFRQARLLKTEELFGFPDDDAAVKALDRADQGYRAAKAAFDAKDWADAEKKLRALVLEYGRAAGAMERCGHLCDAYALYGATLKLRGNEEEAKRVFLDLLALAPQYEFDPKKFPKETVALWQQVGKSLSAQLRGTPTVKTEPPGARVFVNGELVGHTPLTLEPMPIGRLLLRVERPGFQKHGELLPVAADEAEVKITLKPTPEYKAWDATMDKVAVEVQRGKGGPGIGSLGKSLGLDRGLVGTVKVLRDGATEVDLGLYELRGGKRLGGRRTVFQGEEFGQLKNEVSKLVAHIMNQADGGKEKVVKASDPLEGRSGTEEWAGEGKGRSGTDDGKGAKEKTRKKSNDPLDGVSGTEDW